MMAVWLVRVPISVTNAMTGSRTMPAVSAGERSRAMTTIGWSSRGTICFVSPVSSRSSRSHTNSTSCRRSTMYASPPDASAGPNSLPISSHACATAHSAHFFSSRILCSTRSSSIGSPIIVRYASRIAFVSSGAVGQARAHLAHVALRVVDGGVRARRSRRRPARSRCAGARRRRLRVADDERRARRRRPGCPRCP